MVKSDTTKNETVNKEKLPAITTLQTSQQRELDIPEALPMRPQTLDVVRHTVIDPDGKRFVVATYNDLYTGRGYVTAVYPQQNNYLTLVRMTICEFISTTSDEAVKRHTATVQSIQQGRLLEMTKKK